MKKIKIGNTKIQYNSKNVRIINSYKIQSKDQMKEILNEFVKQTGFKSKRTITNWVKEWRAHNILYKLKILKEHTKDCDLQENEKTHRLILYEIVGRF